MKFFRNPTELNWYLGDEGLLDRPNSIFISGPE